MTERDIFLQLSYCSVWQIEILYVDVLCKIKVQTWYEFANAISIVDNLVRNIVRNLVGNLHGQLWSDSFQVCMIDVSLATHAPQPAFTCSRSTIETQEKGVKYVQN